jgi:hypothetical protein
MVGSTAARVSHQEPFALASLVHLLWCPFLGHAGSAMWASGSERVRRRTELGVPSDLHMFHS